MSDQIRTPPHSDGAERSVLGAVLLDNNALALVQERLKPGDFYRDRHRHILRAMLALMKRGKEIDVVTLGDELNREDMLEAIGGAAFLTRLSNEVPSSARVAQYAQMVREKSILRSFIDTAGPLVADAYDDVDDVGAFLDEAIGQLHALDDDGRQERMASADELGERFFQRVEAWKEGDDSEGTGLSTGFPDIDERFRLEDGKLYVLAGRPGMGKTSLANGIQLSLSVERGVPTAFFSLEMSQDEVANRAISTMAEVSLKRAKKGRIRDREFSELIRQTAAFRESPLFVDDTPALSLAALHAKARRLHAQHGIGAIFVDYLQLMTDAGHDIREREIAAISRGLKTIAKRLSIPVIALAQLNRKVEARSDKRPKLADLRESGAIEQDADVVAFLYRDAVYNDQSPDRGVAEFIIRKNRAGAPGTVELKWTPEYTRFDSLSNRRT